ncbi:lipopolysaccharide biosynthesis protein [Sphingomonas sp. 8AM]|uniref:lipopolysaccharide biosynthesis protein n=1 Tax=Sphingomonas sp. 8AM TaxID=2653170 RepID=UPI0012F1BEB3|nr:oligosaccharide flippase family protein [Sphingomonas sp. 8AM]VXC69063.1 conserved membrane hypothetical protein [Sphingomonas sp. 8AM]
MKKISPSLITTAALVISSAINFVGVMIWVRALGPKEFGIYAVLSATALLLNSLLFEWVRSISGRLLYDSRGRYLLNAGKSYILFGITLSLTAILLLSALLIYTLNITLGGISSDLVLYVAVFCVSEMVLGLINSISRVRKLYWQYFTAMVLRAVLVILLGILFVHYFGQGAKGLALATCIGQLATALIVMAADPIWRSVKPATMIRAYTRKDVAELFSFGAPMMLSNGIVYFVSVADRYIIAAFSGSLLVGFYVAPLDLTNKTIGVLMLALNISFYPSIVRAYEDHGKLAATRKLDENFTGQLLALILPILIMVAYPQQVCAIMLGSKFEANSAPVLPALAISVAVRLLIANYLMLVFQLEKRMTGVIVVPLITLALFLPMAFFGVKHSGIVGVALAAAISQILTFAICAMMTRRIMRTEMLSRDNVIVVTLGVALIAVSKLIAAPATTGAFLALCFLVSALFGAGLLILDVGAIRPGRDYIRKRLPW